MRRFNRGETPRLLRAPLLALLLFIAFSLASPCTTLAAEPSLELTACRVGFEGYYKLGRWTPLVATFRAAAPLTGMAEVTVPDGDAVPVTFRSEKISLAAGESAEVPLLILVGRPQAVFEVAFRTESGDSLRWQLADGQLSPAFSARPLDTARRLYVAIGSDLGISAIVEPFSASSRPAVAAIRPEQLAAIWNAYDAVDAVLVNLSPNLYEQLVRERSGLLALDRWVRAGGRLVLCGGRELSTLPTDVAGLEILRPADFAANMVPLRNLGGWEKLAPAHRLPESEVLFVPRLATDGESLAAAGDVPLVVRRPAALGELTLAVADLEAPPFAAWPGRPQLVQSLLDIPAPSDRDWVASHELAPNARGFVDLSSQLSAALEQFPEVTRAPFYAVALVLVGYVLVLWPLDYYFVRRVLGREQAAWTTFAVLVVGLCGGAYALSRQMTGGDVRAETLDLVDYDLSTSLARGTTWLQVFSPTTETYTLNVRPQAAGVTTPELPTLGWHGIPGTGLGGMRSPIAQATVNIGYEITRDYTVDGVPIQVGATKGFSARWLGTFDADDTPFRASLKSDEKGFLRGSIINRTDFALVNCTLVFGPYAYDVQRIDAHSALAIDDETEIIELTSRLSKTRIVLDEKKRNYIPIGQSYDATSTDEGEILTRLLFYDAADGLTATRLSNRFESELDSSRLLQLGRAVLLAEVVVEEPEEAAEDEDSPAAPRTEVLIGGDALPDDRQTTRTYYRLFMPVEPVANP